jgi:hypothetical protein
VFDAREAAQADEYPPFVFTGLDGTEYELPHPNTLTTGQALQLQEAETEAEMFRLFESLAPEATAAIKDMPTYVTEKLIVAWQEEAGETGKSRGPRSVPNRAAKRSRPTLPSAESA